MKRIQMITPWRNSWIDPYVKAFSDWGVQVAPKPSWDKPYDVRMFMWADDIAMNFINEDARAVNNIVFLRRYEFFLPYWRKIDFSKVGNFICVNDYYAKQVKEVIGDQCPVSVIYNGVDIWKWPYKKREHGKNIAMVCFVHWKKNLPLALQILSKLPEDYQLHIAGAIQSPEVSIYLDHLAKSMKRQIIMYGQIPHDEMALWLKDKNYVLSTSLTEGNPNNINEALAMGIKAIVHNWPGAVDQYGHLVFDTIDQAVHGCSPQSEYDSVEYRELAENRFGSDQFLKVKKIAEQLCE